LPTDKWGVNTKKRDTAQSSQSKGKEMMAIELSGEAPPKKKEQRQ